VAGFCAVAGAGRVEERISRQTAVRITDVRRWVQDLEFRLPLVTLNLTSVHAPENRILFHGGGAAPPSREFTNCQVLRTAHEVRGRHALGTVSPRRCNGQAVIDLNVIGLALLCWGTLAVLVGVFVRVAMRPDAGFGAAGKRRGRHRDSGPAGSSITAATPHRGSR